MEKVDLEHLKHTLPKKMFNRHDPKWMFAFSEYNKTTDKKLGMSCSGCYLTVYNFHKGQSEKLPPFTLGTIRDYSRKTQAWEKVSFDELMRGLKNIFK